MKLVSNKTIKKIFLTSDTKINNITDKIAIILAPEFYWVRRFDLIAKTEKQAKNLLPELFSDVTRDPKSLSYQAVKKDTNLFLCFAYDEKIIQNAIINANIPISNIASIHFAQNECKTYDKFEINKQKFVYTEDNILTEVPYTSIDGAIDLEELIDKIKLTPYKIKIKLNNSIFNINFYLLSIIVLLVLLYLDIDNKGLVYKLFQKESIPLKKEYLITKTDSLDKFWNNIAIKPIQKNEKLDGLKIEEVTKNSTTDKLRLKKGDIIKAINGKQINSFSDIFKVYNQIKNIKHLSLEVLRNDKTVELRYKIN